MAKYKLMLFYTFLFFWASISLIILGSNLSYEVVTGRQEKRPEYVERGGQWLVQKNTKGLPPMRIITQVEWRRGTDENYRTIKATEVHWSNIFGVMAFSVFVSGLLIFIGAAMLEVLSKVDLPWLKKPRLSDSKA